MTEQDKQISLLAAAVTVGVVAAHHVSEGTVDTTIVALAKSEAAKGVLVGAGGGAMVGVVTKASIAEIIGRTFVGGMMAAAVAPWLAESVLHVNTNSSTYPVLCCSIGVLGFQLVKGIADHPENIPIIGAVLGPLLGRKGGQGAQDPAPLPSPAPTPNVAVSPLPGPAYRYQEPAPPQVRVPLMR